MGENDGEIFKRLREIGEGVARIDERTARIDGDGSLDSCDDQHHLCGSD